jgi:DNA polymerase III delta subunit
MVYFLYGEDSFRALEFIKSVFQGKRYRKIAFEDFSFKDIASEISTDSLFGDLLEVEHLFIRGDSFSFKDEIPQSAILSKKKIIVFYFEKINEDKVKKIDLKIKVKKFEQLKGSPLKKYIKNYLNNLGIKFEEDAIDILGDFCQGDLWKMATEVQSILLRKNESEILKKDLLYITPFNLQQNAFLAIDAALSNQKSRSFKILDKLIKEEDEFKIIGALNWQIKNLIVVKDLFLKNYNLAMIQKISQMPYFVAQKSLQQSSRFKLEDLIKIHLDLIKLYFNLRKLKIAPQILIERFIHSL